MNARFEALDKRLNFLQWLIGIGITLLGGLITLLNFFSFNSSGCDDGVPCKLC
jgi:hypothetical protein